MLYAVVGCFGGGYYSAPLACYRSRDAAEARAQALRSDPRELLGFDDFEVVEVELAD